MSSNVSREEYVREQLREQLPPSVEVPKTVLRTRNPGIPATVHLERDDIKSPRPLCRKKAGRRDWEDTGLQRKPLSVFTSISVCRDCLKQLELSNEA